MDYTVVRRIIEEDLGAKPEELFREFDKIPLAAASLAQVLSDPRRILHARCVELTSLLLGPSRCIRFTTLLRTMDESLP
jgi:hypothetical protein